jgi:succinate dehydrogenase/fumarate reductase cytochrome b subunit
MELAKNLQKTLNQKANPKTDLYVDLAESVTGIILVGFLWMHIFQCLEMFSLSCVSPKLIDNFFDTLSGC